jgi:DnaJ-class molecular chaperone
MLKFQTDQFRCKCGFHIAPGERPLASAYDILGIRPKATREELDAAYAAKRVEYATQRLASLPDEFQRLAAQ